MNARFKQTAVSVDRRRRYAGFLALFDVALNAICGDALGAVILKRIQERLYLEVDLGKDCGHECDSP